MDDKPLILGLGQLGRNPTADLYASFDSICRQLSERRNIAEHGATAEARAAALKDVCKFVEFLEENGLLDYLLLFRKIDETKP